MKYIVPALLGLLLLSCAVPLYERAGVRPGLSGNVAAGAAAGSFGREMNSGNRIYDFGAVGTAALGYGFSDRFGLFLSPAGAIALPRTTEAGRQVPWAFDAQLGAKVALGKRDALKLGVSPLLLFDGVSSLFPYADLVWLHDFGRRTTTALGVGMRGIHLHVGQVVWRSRRRVDVVSFNAALGAGASGMWPEVWPTYTWSASVGWGSEFFRPAK